MKTIRFFIILVIIVSFAANSALSAENWESYELVNKLLTMTEPGVPLIHDKFVVFTANSSIRRIGVSFANENFDNIYWFRPLLIPQDRINPIILPGEKVPSPYKDSGIQFCVYQIPDHLRELEYRLVINGLWTIDPANPLTRLDRTSGLTMSILKLPYRPIKHSPLNGLPAGLDFSFHGPPGEIVTVAGTFNNWDPFMYELKENPSGVYRLIIPLPPGKYQYVFFHRGERFIDPDNPNRIYAKDGRIASEIEIP